MNQRHVITAFGLAFALFAVSTPFAAETVVTVPAWRETAAAPTTGDAADDPTVWVHPTDPAQSLVIGTNKDGGLMVMGLDGKSVQYLEGGEPNNVDVRSGVMLGGQPRAIVAASERKANTIATWVVDEATRTLKALPMENCKPVIEVYGFGLYKSAKDGRLYGIITSKDGGVEQWELRDNGTGNALTAQLARAFDLGGQCEGAVADDANGVLYIGEEAVAVWRVDAEPDAKPVPVAVDYAKPKGKLTADIEGVALSAAGPGYLVVSAQGSNSFCVYERAKHTFVGEFSIGAANGVDEVSGTDGIEVISVDLGAGLEAGLFIAQDDEDDAGNQNFKLVPWSAITDALGLKP